MIRKRIVAIATIFCLPLISLAAENNLGGLITNIGTTVFAPLIPVLFGLALIIFFWGLIQYMRAGLGEKGKLDEAKKLMFWGIIILFVMLSVWGLVGILKDTFFSGSSITAPTTLPKI